MRTKQAHRRRQVARVVDGVRVLPGFRSYPMLYVSSAVRARQHRDDFADVRTFLLFVGHPRSGHSLVGSLLDAHPDVVVSHELDALKYVAAGYRRAQLFTLVLEHSKANAAAGRKSWGYSYAVPDQWQGRYDRLQVVGDKRGRRDDGPPRRATRAASTGWRPRCRYRSSVVQVVRDPFDNIATMWRRGTAPLDVPDRRVLRAVRDGRRRSPARVDPARYHRLRLEDLIADPQASSWPTLCRFLDVRARARLPRRVRVDRLRRAPSDP